MKEIIKQIGIFLGYDPDGHKDHHKNKQNQDAFGMVYSTAEWLITAFAVTLIFIVFFMQAYTIPTGSMADTLKGAHFRLRCQQCGYRYDYGYAPEAYGRPQNYTPMANVSINSSISYPGGVFTQHLPKCPCCGYYSTTAQDMPVVKGDRIFVAKCLYQFTEPKRWDVIVFKNPTEPRINYIKRLIGKPGETVEIIDGDIYIDGTIARKPPKVQQELWMPIYDNDFQPIAPHERGFNSHTWAQPFVNTNDSFQWNLNADGPTVFTLESPADKTSTLVYDTSKGNDFKATYAYNDPVRFDNKMPVCSDLMIRFNVLENDFTGKIGAVLTKHGIKYLASIDSNGKMEIIQSDANGKNISLDSMQVNLKKQKSNLFQFSNADHVLTLTYGGESLICDLDKDSENTAQPNPSALPQAMIFGSGKLKIAHIGLYRDIHYLSTMVGSKQTVRAGQGNPFTLGEDEFFACGDNSPNSKDSRLWDEPGKANGEGNQYPMGVVPRDYLVGKAFFVYWPGGFKPKDKSRIQLIPYVKGIKRIYGGID